MSENQKQWYVVRAVGGKENKVKEYLEAEIRRGHLEDLISQVLIPTEKVFTIRNGKKVSWPSFSSLQNSTLIVMVASLIFALIVLVMDRSFDGIMGKIYELLG